MTVTAVLIAAVSLLCSCAAPHPEIRPPVVSKKTTLARRRPPPAPAPLPPIQQLVASRRLVCAMRGHTAYCREQGERFKRELENVSRLAVRRWGRGLCATALDHTVRCGDQTLPFPDPDGTLTASEHTVCAFSGRTIHCYLFRSHYKETQSRAVTLRLSDSAGEVASVGFYDHFGHTPLIAVDARGRAYRWSNIRDPAAPGPRPWRAAEPLREVQPTHHGWAALTESGKVLYSARLLSLDSGLRQLCGVDHVAAMQVEPGRICLLTAAGLTCVKHQFLREEDWRLGPPHEPCGGPRGPMARTDLEHLAANRLGPSCVATRDQVFCAGGGLGARWRPAAPLIHRGALQIASGNDFNCALLRDGRVRCAGPSFGVLGQTEELPGARGAQRIFAGQHGLCALFPDRLQCWSRGVTAAATLRGRWIKLRPLRLRHRPRTVHVADHGLTWEAGDRVYRYDIFSPQRSDATPWLLGPRPRRAAYRRFRRDRVSPRRPGPRVVAVSRGYTLFDDGRLIKVGRRGLGAPELIFGALTGGIFLPFMQASRPRYRRELTPYPGTVELAAGIHHLCQRTSAGVLACSGHDANGELRGAPGGAHASWKHPVVRELGAPVRGVSAGDWFTCALLEGGDVRCWGRWGRRLIRPPGAYPAWRRMSWPAPAAPSR